MPLGVGALLAFLFQQCPASSAQSPLVLEAADLLLYNAALDETTETAYEVQGYTLDSTYDTRYHTREGTCLILIRV